MSTKSSYRIILLGPPASGKGTQASKLKDEYHVPHLSTGDMLRTAAARGTPTGKTAKKYMESGELVPDDLIIEIVEEAIKEKQCEHGFILDGFPRTIHQAEKLDELLEKEGLNLTAVVDLEIDDELLVHRILGRLFHPPSGRTYHEEFCPPKVPMTDDVTGEPLIRRSDDNEETLKKRLAEYHSMTAPITAYYVKKGVLHPIDGSKSAEEVWAQIVKAVGQDSA